MKPSNFKHLICILLLCLCICLQTGCELPGSLRGGFRRGPVANDDETQIDDSSQAADYSDVLGGLDGVSFTYAGPDESWKTVFQMGRNGTFTGTYKSKDKRLKGKKYSKGTVYTSEFSGKFSITGKENDLCYMVRLDELLLSNKPGEETIRKKTRYVTTNAYGLNESDEFTMYMPGFKSSQLPDDFKSIVSTTRQLSGKLPSEINFCGLYNAEAKSGFTSENFFVDGGSNSYEAYLNILGYYEGDIERYNWKYSAHTRPCALCDINGDGTKEFLFFTSETDEGPGILHIYTFKDGKAVEVSYPAPSGAGEAGSNIVFTDANTGSGTSYLIFKDNEEDAIWIYRRHGDTSITYWLCEYKLNKDAALEEAYTLIKQGDGSVYNDTSGAFYQNALAEEGGSILENGKELSFEDGIKAFEAGFDHIGDALLASTPTAGISIWNKYEDSDLLALSSEEMTAVLSD